LHVGECHKRTLLHKAARGADLIPLAASVIKTTLFFSMAIISSLPSFYAICASMPNRVTQVGSVVRPYY
jgi:hypothetical protein